MNTALLPAFAGGTPMFNVPLPYGRHSVSEEDIQAVAKTLRSDWLTTGPQIEAFEETLAAYTGSAYAVAFSSATAGLHAAVSVAGLSDGHSAITSPLTFCATANCIVYCNANPVFADVDEAFLTLDPQKTEAVLTSETRVVLPVDYAGCPADLDTFMQMAEKRNLIIIEDAAHALGATYHNRKIGSVSHMSVFSFHPVKPITTGEGGAVTTDNEAFAKALRRFRSHGITHETQQKGDQPWHYDMAELGMNYRMSDIACALGLSQLRRLDENIARRVRIAQHYNAALASLKGIRLPEVRSDCTHAWHLYPIRVEVESFGMTRQELLKALHAENIRVQVHYIPVHYHSFYRKNYQYQEGLCPVAEQAYEMLLSLPIFPSMSDANVQSVITALERIAHYIDLKKAGCIQPDLSAKDTA